MPAVKGVLTLIGGFCIVVVSFVGTSYVLNTVAPGPDAELYETTGSIVAQATPVGDLPALAEAGSSPVAWTVIDGLNASPASEHAVHPGQSVLKLVALATQGGHNLSVRFSSLQKNKVYTIVLLLKPESQALTFVQVHDQKPTNYGIVFCDLAGQKILDAKGSMVSQSIEPDRDGWSRLKLAMRNADGLLDVTVGFVSAPAATVFKGDGRSALKFGGIDAIPQG
jgi:hypothetical protein